MVLLQNSGILPRDFHIRVCHTLHTVSLPPTDTWKSIRSAVSSGPSDKTTCTMTWTQSWPSFVFPGIWVRIIVQVWNMLFPGPQKDLPDNLLSSLRWEVGDAILSSLFWEAVLACSQTTGPLTFYWCCRSLNLCRIYHCSPECYVYY